MNRHPRRMPAAGSYQSSIDGSLRRSRRTKKGTLPLGGRKSNKAGGSQAPYAQPPVLARGAPSATPPQAIPRSKSRRRYDVALGMPGLEMRLPSLPVFHLGWHYLSGLLAMALLGLLYYIWTAPMFRIQQVEVQGLQRVSRADLYTVLNLTDEPIFLIDPEKMRADLQMAFPEMSAITVEVRLPASVLVTVKERVPVLVWQKEGQELWVDAEGVTFAPRGEARPDLTIEGALPVLEASPVAPAGLGENPRLDAELVSAILTVGAYAPKKARLVYDAEHGLGWREKRGARVFFGATGLDASTLELKLRIYMALLERLNKKEIRPLLISVENVHAPYYRLER